MATRQHGVVSRRQLLALGFGEAAIKTRMAGGRLQAIHRETFAVGHAMVSKRGLWLAAVLAFDERALLSHFSAAALWGLTGSRTKPIHVTACSGRQGAPPRSGIRLHRCRLVSEDGTLRDRLPVTTPERTLFDLAEVVDADRLRYAWEEADRLRLLRLDAMQRVVERGRGRRALRWIRPLLAEARAATETRSPLEDRFAAFLYRNRVPPPAHNVLVLGHEVDTVWPEAKLIAELDSWEFHGNRAAFNRDRARDSARLVAGYRTIRITHHRLDHEADTLLAELRSLLGLLAEHGSSINC